MPREDVNDANGRPKLATAKPQVEEVATFLSEEVFQVLSVYESCLDIKISRESQWCLQEMEPDGIELGLSPTRHEREG